MDEYLKFLESKRHTSNDYGIKATWLPRGLFDFQEYVAEYSIKKGRCADFLDTGLGKTIIELVHAVNYVREKNKPVLILTPLAVAFQFLKEAEKFGIDDVEYSKDGKFSKKIVICNYERLHYFDEKHFDCVILDESSILKNFDGAIKAAITSFLKKIKYRFLFTATPSPNDFIELGTSSEALGYMGYMDMLSRFFKNNEDTISPMNIGTEWVLKGHAREDFFKWVSSWSISMRRPSDLGFSDEKHILPELIINQNMVNSMNTIGDNGQDNLFPIIAKTQSEIKTEQRHSINSRCEKAVELASKSDVVVYWCNLNNEGDLLTKLDKNAFQIRGSMSIDEKEEILMAFASGEIKRLVTKPKMTAFGLNWQHCNQTIYFPTFSYEQFYQAIRRFWRFGQMNPVTVDIVLSEGQQRVMQSITEKSKKANELFDKLNYNINKRFENKTKKFDKQVKLPSFL